MILITKTDNDDIARVLENLIGNEAPALEARN